MKLMLLDDHALVRTALESVIQSLGRVVSVLSVGTAAQARSALAESGPLDLVILDLQLPDADGFTLMTEWRRTHPGMRVVILSASEHPTDVLRALEEGALGFIPKRTPIEVLMHALRMVMSGGVYVPPMALGVGAPLGERNPWAGLLVAQEGGAPLRASSVQRTGGAEEPPRDLHFTPRQSEVLELLLQGQPNKLIARHLNLSVETVKDHVASILRLLGVSSRTQAVLAVSHLKAGGSTPVRVPPYTVRHLAAAGRPAA
jgi:DNA-binding NarL/FixJ family response regulator